MWVALRLYTNVCLRPIYIGTVVVKGLKLKINFNFVNECDHVLCLAQFEHRRLKSGIWLKTVIIDSTPVVKVICGPLTSSE